MTLTLADVVLAGTKAARMDPVSKLQQLTHLLDRTFPGGDARLALDPDSVHTIRNAEYVLRLTPEFVDGLGDRSAGDIAQVLVAMGYADDLRQHRCLEVLRDLTCHPWPSD